jgi:hypothetical protein
MHKHKNIVYTCTFLKRINQHFERAHRKVAGSAELVSSFVLLTRLGKFFEILACDSMDFPRSKRVSSEKPPTDLGGLGPLLLINDLVLLFTNTKLPESSIIV